MGQSTNLRSIIFIEKDDYGGMNEQTEGLNRYEMGHIQFKLFFQQGHPPHYAAKTMCPGFAKLQGFVLRALEDDLAWESLG